MVKRFLLIIAFLASFCADAALGPKTLVLNGAMTGTAAIHTTGMDLLNLQLGAFQAIWTGTPTGAFIVEGSIDGSTWDNIGASGWTDPAGAAGHLLINIYGASFRYLRLTYTNASSTGTLQILGMAK